MARPFDGSIFDRNVFDCDDSPTRPTKDYKNNQYILARPGGRIPRR